MDRVAAVVAQTAVRPAWELDYTVQGQTLLEHPLFDGVEAARRQERDGAWREWAGKAVGGSARAGHRYIAEPAVRNLRTVTGADGLPSACSQAVADAYGDHYVGLWGATATRGEAQRRVRFDPSPQGPVGGA